MKPLTLLITSLFLLPVFSFGQDCDLDSPITATGTRITQSNLEQLVNTHQPVFDARQLQEVKQNIAACNRQLEQELRALETTLSGYSLKYQEVLSYKDVAGIRQQIADLEASKQTSLEEMERNLSNVRHSAIFVVLLKDINPYTAPEDLINQGQAAVSPVAIRDINGEYITRLTEVTEYNAVRDVIESFSSGEVTFDQKITDEIARSSRYFLYSVKVGVKPLKEEVNGLGRETPTNAIVLNLSFEPNYQNALRLEGVSDEHILALEAELTYYLGGIDAENQNSTTRQQQILQRGNEEIRRIEREIEEARRRLDTRSRKLQELCSDLNVRFDAGNLDATATRLLAHLETQMQEASTAWNNLKEKEILYRETRVTIEGSPAESFAQEALKLHALLNNDYGSIEKKQEYVRVEDFSTTEVQNSGTVELYRTVDQVWVYPIPRDDNAFDLVVFATFEIIGVEEKKEGATEPAPPRTSGNMIFIEGGSFWMGSTEGYDDKQPVHQVEISSFYLGKYEVTNVEFVQFLNDAAVTVSDDEISMDGVLIYDLLCFGVKCDDWQNRIIFSNRRFSVIAGYEQHPVVMITWYGAVHYCNWRSRQDGYTPVYSIRGINITANWSANGYRLPTEAEWEYAASEKGGPNKWAGTSSENRLSEYANFCDRNCTYSWKTESQNDGHQFTATVGNYKSNSLDLHDMSGNVIELCWDWYDPEYYDSSPRQNPRGPGEGVGRVVRGGSFTSSRTEFQCAQRGRCILDYKRYDIGFRLSRSAN